MTHFESHTSLVYITDLHDPRLKMLPRIGKRYLITYIPQQAISLVAPQNVG